MNDPGNGEEPTLSRRDPYREFILSIKGRGSTGRQSIGGRMLNKGWTDVADLPALFVKAPLPALARSWVAILLCAIADDRYRVDELARAMLVVSRRLHGVDIDSQRRAGGPDETLEVMRTTIDLAREAGFEGVPMLHPETATMRRNGYDSKNPNPQFGRAAISRERQRRAAKATQGVEALTPTESRVYLMLSCGATVGDISQKMRITTGTVHVHLANIGSKLGIRGAANVRQYAVEHPLPAMEAEPLVE